MQENSSKEGLIYLDFFGNGPKGQEKVKQLNAKYLDMSPWAQELSYAYSHPSLKAQEIPAKIFAKYAIHLKNFSSFHLEASGDFHHLSHLLLSYLISSEKLPSSLHLVIFDNHPDNMIYPFGIHCGSWVYHASLLPQIKRISVIGMTSQDLNGLNIFQNHYSPMREGKIHYYPFKKVGPLMKFLGGKQSIHEDFSSTPEKDWPFLLKQIVDEVNLPLYLSIDKDVCLKEDLPTNWDQGILRSQNLLDMISNIKSSLVALDMVGGKKTLKASSTLKKILRKLDGDHEENLSLEEENKIKKLHDEFDQKLYEIWRAP